MEKRKGVPEFITPKSETKTSLFKYLDEQGIKYATEEGENGEFCILITSPEEHLTEQQEQMKRLGSLETTKWQNNVFQPFIRKINGSKNLKCQVEKSPENQYRISISKK